MIISKPKFNALFSLSIFTIASLVIGIFGVNFLYEGENAWWAYLLPIIFLPIGVYLMIKITWGYKVITINNKKFKINLPFRLKTKTYNTKQIVSWEEAVVKTGSGPFKEMVIRFEDGYKLSLSFHENGNYNKIHSYLSKGVSKKGRS